MCRVSPAALDLLGRSVTVLDGQSEVGHRPPSATEQRVGLLSLCFESDIQGDAPVFPVVLIETLLAHEAAARLAVDAPLLSLMAGVRAAVLGRPQQPPQCLVRLRTARDDLVPLQAEVSLVVVPATLAYHLVALGAEGLGTPVGGVAASLAGRVARFGHPGDHLGYLDLQPDVDVLVEVFCRYGERLPALRAPHALSCSWKRSRRLQTRATEGVKARKYSWVHEQLGADGTSTV